MATVRRRTYVWDDLRVPLTATKLGGSKDPTYSKLLDNGAGSQGIFTYAFSHTSEEELYFACQLPHSYYRGSALSPHVHWTHLVASPPGNTTVRWGLEYAWQDINEQFPATSTIVYGSDTVAADSVRKHHLTSITDIAGTGMRESSMLVCRLFRDVANDDFAASAYALEFDIHYQQEKSGTVNEVPDPD